MKEKMDLEGLQANRQTDEELKNDILNINKSQLYKITNMSYQFFIRKALLTIKTLEDKNLLNDIDETKEKALIYQNFKYMVDLFKTLNDRDSKVDVDHEMDILLDIRKSYKDLLETLYGYEIELSYIKELFNYYTIKLLEKKKYKNTAIDKNKIHMLKDKIKEVLSNDGMDYLSYMNINSNILAILPFRLTKSKYFDILDTTIIRNIKGLPVELAENQIEEYKKIFNSPLHDNYGIMFDDYFTRIQRFKKLSLKDLNLEELDSEFKEINDLSIDLKTTRKLIRDIGILINRLIVIVLNKDKLDLDYKEEVLLGFENWENKVDEESMNLLMDKSKRLFIKTEKELLKDIDNLKKANAESLKRKDFSNQDLNDKILFTSNVLTYYNDIEFRKHKTLFPETEEPITDEHLQQLIENLIHYIKRSIKEMDGVEIKIRMRRLLSVLELPFTNIQELISYVEYSLDKRLVSKGEILFALDTLNHWLDGLDQ